MRGFRIEKLLRGVAFVAAVAAVTLVARNQWLVFRSTQVRKALFAEIQPVRLTNCELRRFGEPHDGGYPLCENLLGRVKSGYSYGISGYDGWGCEVSARLRVRVHQYDCFNLSEPSCPGGQTIFHGECIGTTKETQDGRPFDSLAGQFARNGDPGAALEFGSEEAWMLLQSGHVDEGAVLAQS